VRAKKQKSKALSLAPRLAFPGDCKRSVGPPLVFATLRRCAPARTDKGYAAAVSLDLGKTRFHDRFPFATKSQYRNMTMLSASIIRCLWRDRGLSHEPAIPHHCQHRSEMVINRQSPRYPLLCMMVIFGDGGIPR
jgi:hypothetical protein